MASQKETERIEEGEYQLSWASSFPPETFMTSAWQTTPVNKNFAAVPLTPETGGKIPSSCKQDCSRMMTGCCGKHCNALKLERGF